MKDETWERYLSSLLDIIKDQKAEIECLKDAVQSLMLPSRPVPPELRTCGLVGELCAICHGSIARYGAKVVHTPPIESKPARWAHWECYYHPIEA